MRDPNRIHGFLKTVELNLKENQALSIGKILNVVGENRMIYYVEDDAFLDLLQKDLHINVDPSKLSEPLEDQNLQAIEKLWKKVPDFRFTQLVCNMVEDESILGLISDDKLIEYLSQYYS